MAEQPHDEAAVLTPGPDEARAALARTPLFSSLSRETLAALSDACEIEHVAGGDRLLSAGESLASLIVVVHGGLRVVRYSDDGYERVLRDFYRGDVLGVIGLLSDRPLPVNLFAVRDSVILRLSRARFLSLVEAHPSLLVVLARLLSERSFDILETLVGPQRRTPSARGGNLAVLPLSRDPAVQETKDLLIEIASKQRRVTRVNPQLVDSALGPGTAAVPNGPGMRVAAWLSQLEQGADVVLYEGDVRSPVWTARCKRQADRLVMIAAASDISQIDALARAMTEQPSGLMRPIDLVLVHPPGTSLPSLTKRWARLPDVRAFHHVRRGRRADVERLVRRLIGEPIGLVLSGGGARGIAHVGVITALVEAGIPIDYVCGTSMGAIFAAGVALGLDIDEMQRQVRDLFGTPFSLYDLTVPISSLLKGEKLNKVLQKHLGGCDIEDLWLPFFCVSTDLSRAQLVVHDRGALWKSVRASCSIPGIFPPVPFGERLLVDGGVVDNLPLDLMIERCTGPVIAVDVFPYGDPTFQNPTNRLSRWLRAVRTRIRGETASPPLFDILIRSTLVGSKIRQQVPTSRAEHVVYLEPPVASFGALQWRSHKALIEVGYQYAKRELERERALFPSG